MNGNEINNVALVLDHAGYLIESEGWCQGMPAMDRYGFPTTPRADDAVSFCAVGALTAAMEPGADGEYHLARAYMAQAAGRTLHPTYLPEWNDAPLRSRQEVIEMFVRAADLAREDARAAGYRATGP